MTSDQIQTPWDTGFITFVTKSIVDHLAKKDANNTVVGSHILPKSGVLELDVFADLAENHGGTIKECIDWLAKQENAPFLYPDIRGAGAGYRLPGFSATTSPTSLTSRKYLTDDVVVKITSLMTTNCTTNPVSVEFLASRALPTTSTDAEIQACCDEILKGLSAGLFTGFTRNGVKSRKVVKVETVTV